jgi:hypothetical protein
MPVAEAAFTGETSEGVLATGVALGFAGGRKPLGMWTATGADRFALGAGGVRSLTAGELGVTVESSRSIGARLWLALTGGNFAGVAARVAGSGATRVLGAGGRPARACAGDFGGLGGARLAPRSASLKSAAARASASIRRSSSLAPAHSAARFSQSSVSSPSPRRANSAAFCSAEVSASESPGSASGIGTFATALATSVPLIDGAVRLCRRAIFGDLPNPLNPRSAVSW